MLKNITFLFSGLVLSQLLSLVGAFFIPRYLGPDQYGEYQIIINYVLTYKLLTFTGINKVNIRDLSKNGSQLSKVINETLLLRIALSIAAIVLGSIILIFTDYNDQVIKGIILFFVFLILFSLSNTINSIFYIIQRFKFISYITITKSIAQVSLSVLAVLLGYGVITLICIYLMAEFIALILGFYYSIKFANYRFSVVPINPKILIKKGIHFSLIDFFNMLSSRIDIVMLSFLTDPFSIGIYALSNTLARKGLIIRRAIQQPLFPYYAEKDLKSIKFSMLNKHLGLILIPSTIIVLVIYFFADFVILTVAGSNFLPSAEILKVLTFYLFFHYAVMPFSSVFEAQKMEKLSLWIGVLRAVLNVSLNLILFKYYGIMGIAYSTVSIWGVNFIVFYLLAYKKLSNVSK